MAPSKAVRGRDASIYVDSINASAFLNEYEIEAERDDIDVTPFESSDKVFLAGTSENTVTLTGFFNGAVDSLDEILDNTFGGDAENVVTICPAGALSGKACYLVAGTQVAYTTSAESDDMTEAEAEFRSARLRGRVLKTPVAETATGNGTANIATAATTKGAVAHLHVTSVTGAPTSVVIVFEGSTDGTTWAPLITFTSVTGVTFEKKETAATTTVPVQIRAKHTITGGATPTVTYLLAVAVPGRKWSA